MRFQGLCYPHPQVRIEISTWDLEYILDCIESEKRSERLPQAHLLREEIQKILKRVERER
jgi:hypothetical protein